jgi:spore photoproduct lyase
MNTFQPEKIYVDTHVQEAPLTKKIVDNASGVSVEFITDIKAATADVSSHIDPIGRGKKHLLITSYKGPMIKPCPGTPRVLCCNYQIINPIIGCPFDCTYCALQMYFNNPIITVYTNTEELLNELDARLLRRPKWLLRIGTGELTDSLALDHITEMSILLVPRFAEKKNVLFELKTKSNHIEHLLNLNHGGRTVVAWSLNPQKIIEQEEPGTASLLERFKAAQQCQEAGYKLAFHFDPLLYYSDWEKDYMELVDRLFTHINARHIVWISLGTFRYPPSLKPIIRERFPESKIVYEDFIKGQDGKMRYLKPLRVQMYSAMLSKIRACAPEVFVYLCMESNDVWKKVTGRTPRTRAGLAKMFHDVKI